MSSITPYTRMNYPGAKIKRDETVSDIYALEVMDMPTFTVLPGPSESRLAYKMPENAPYYSDGSAWYPLLGSASIKSGLGVTVNFSGNSMVASANIISGPGVQITNVGNTMVVGANIVGSIGVDVVQTGNSLVLSGNVVSGNGITVTNSGNSRVINLTRNIVNSVGPYQTLVNNGNPSLGDYSLKNLFFQTAGFAATSDTNTVFVNPLNFITPTTVSIRDYSTGNLVTDIGGIANPYTLGSAKFSRIGNNVTLVIEAIQYTVGISSAQQFIIIAMTNAIPSWCYPICYNLSSYGNGTSYSGYLNGQRGLLYSFIYKDSILTYQKACAIVSNGSTSFYLVVGIDGLTKINNGVNGYDGFVLSYQGLY